MKENSNQITTAVCASLASLGLAIPAMAQSPLTIANPGFEEPILANGAYQAGPPPGWNAFNGANVGVLNPTTGDLPDEAPEGENVALVTSSVEEDGLTQTLTSTFQADANYTLSAVVGNTLFTGSFPGYRVQLLAGGTLLAEDDNSLVLAEGAVATSTASYTYDAADSGLVGQPLEIRLLSKGLVAGEEVAYDDVQLTVALANPAADSGGPYQVTIPDGSLSLDGSGSLPSDGQTIVSWEWDLTNDGNFDDATGATPATIDYATLTAAPPSGFGMVEGENTIKLRVTDDSSPAKTSIAETIVTLAELSTTMTASSNWVGGDWDNGEPAIGVDAVIAEGVTATATNSVNPWSGMLTLEANAILNITSGTNPNPPDMAFDGATEFILKDGSQIRDNYKTMTFEQNFTIEGTAGLNHTTNAGNNHNRTFTGTISGDTWVTDGRNHVGYTYNSANTFAAYEVRSTDSQRHGVAFNAPGAAGLGNVTVTNGSGSQSAVLILGADDVFDESCILTLNGQGWANTTGGFGPYASGAWVGNSMRIFMSTFNATVSELWIDDVQRAAGDYTGTSGDWIGGTGTLTVINGPDDTDPPTLAPADIVDNVSGGPIFETETVTYTLTFSEPVDPTTVDVDDFENGGTSPATIESVVVNDEVVMVVVSPGGPGTLILQVKAGAIISDYAGNNMDTTTAIADDTNITVNPEIPPTLVSIENSVGDGPVFENQPFTYFLTFDKALDPASVDAGDFENASGPAITITNVTAYNDPTTYAVDVTPGGTGTITLGIKEGAYITSAYGTPIDTTTAITDDTTITVNAGSGPARGMITVDATAAWNANSTTITGTLNASGSDKLVVVVTGEHGNPGNHTGTSSAVTYDGVPLTKVVERNPVPGPSGTSVDQDQTFNDIWYLDNPATSDGEIVATVITRGNVTAFALSGTAPGVGQSAISPQASKSVVLSTSFANSIVIASHGMGGDGNSANVGAVSAVSPLVQTSAQSTGNIWDGHVTAYAFVPVTTTATYEFEGGNLIGSHTIAAEFISADGTPPGDGPFATWSGGLPANGDANGDGVANAIAWVLGAADPNANALGLLPTLDTTSDAEYVRFTFNRLGEANADTATTIAVEYSTDLVTWTPAVNDGDNVIIDVTAASPSDTVVVRLKRSALAADGKLFARLNVEIIE